MRAHYIQHVRFEGPAFLETWATGQGHAFRGTRLCDGDPLPSVEEFEWLIILGGPMGVDDDERYPWMSAEKQLIEQAVKANRWVLGICLGAQMIAHVLGAKVTRNTHKEIGWHPVSLTGDAERCVAFSGLSSPFPAFHWHGDVFEIPRGGVRVAQTEACANQAFVYQDRVVGLQFHLEVTLDSVARLVQNCAQELVDGPYIQTAAQMIGREEQALASNQILDGLLNRMGLGG